MKLELNIVSTRNTYGILFRLLDRKRVFVDDNNPQEALRVIWKYLDSVSEILDTAVSDKELLNFINSGAKDGTITDLMSIKYLLTQSGLDLLFYALDDDETRNPDDIKEGTSEYNIIDSTMVINQFIPSVTKVIQVAGDNNFANVFRTMYEDFAPFKDAYLSSDRYLKPNIEALQETSEMTGNSPQPIAENISNIFSYLGKDLVIINPSM